MNINRVYECEIWGVVSTNMRSGNIVYKSIFFKKALVYHTKSDQWIDLNTKETYAFGPVLFNDLFINPDRPIIPVFTLIDTKKSNMNKRKILKKYKEKNGGNNEYK